MQVRSARSHDDRNTQPSSNAQCRPRRWIQPIGQDHVRPPNAQRRLERLFTPQPIEGASNPGHRTVLKVMGSQTRRGHCGVGAMVDVSRRLEPADLGISRRRAEDLDLHVVAQPEGRFVDRLPGVRRAWHRPEVGNKSEAYSPHTLLRMDTVLDSHRSAALTTAVHSPPPTRFVARCGARLLSCGKACFIPESAVAGSAGQRRALQVQICAQPRRKW